MCPAIDFPLFKLEDLTEEEYENFKKNGKFDLDARNDNGNTALHCAVLRNLPNVVMLLLQPSYGIQLVAVVVQIQKLICSPLRMNVEMLQQD